MIKEERCLTCGHLPLEQEYNIFRHIMKCPRCKKRSILSCQSYQCVLEREERRRLGKKIEE